MFMWPKVLQKVQLVVQKATQAEIQSDLDLDNDVIDAEAQAARQLALCSAIDTGVRSSTELWFHGRRLSRSKLRPQCNVFRANSPTLSSSLSRLVIVNSQATQYTW